MVPIKFTIGIVTAALVAYAGIAIIVALIGMM